VLKPYRELFAAPGALAFSLAGFVARMPISMEGIGIVLLVSATTGSYATAGGVSATSAFVAALAAPQVARAVDKRGQARVAVPALAVFAASLGAFLACAEARAPVWALYVTAGLAGASMPNIGAFVRARWAVLYTGTPRLHTAYALESTIDELIFIIGPVLATVLATQVTQLSGLAAVLLFAVTGTLALVAQRATEPVPTGRGRHEGQPAIGVPGIRVLMLVFAALGCLFGAMEITVVAFATEHGHRAVAGVILAVYASGSGLAGIIFGTLRLSAPLHRRFLAGVSCLAASIVALPFIPSLTGLTAMFFAAGFAISPTLISGFALVESLARPGQLTEGLTWLTSGILIGVTAGTALSGWVIDAAGAGRACYVPVVSGAIAALSAYAGARWLRPALNEEETGERAIVEQLGR
jgi:predicted MFS family arabinose efflux permease